jgi:hypothetical protein
VRVTYDPAYLHWLAGEGWTLLEIFFIQPTKDNLLKVYTTLVEADGKYKREKGKHMITDMMYRVGIKGNIEVIEDKRTFDSPSDSTVINSLSALLSAAYRISRDPRWTAGKDEMPQTYEAYEVFYRHVLGKPIPARLQTVRSELEGILTEPPEIPGL